MCCFKNSWGLPLFAILLVLIIGVSLFSTPLFSTLVHKRVYKAEEEFIYWHDAEVTNKLHEIDSGVRDYLGPTAAFTFEERLMAYSPTCMINRVVARFYADHPTIVCPESKILALLSSAEYFNSGNIVPHVHVIVSSEDADLGEFVAESFVKAVADVVEEEATNIRLKAVEQIQKRLARLQEKRKSLVSISDAKKAIDASELRRIDMLIEGLKADIKRVKSMSKDTEPRVFRIQRNNMIR